MNRDRRLYTAMLFGLDSGAGIGVAETKTAGRRSSFIMSKTERLVFVFVGILLVITFVRRLFPVDEMPGHAVMVITILCDVGMAVGLVGLGTKILKATPQGTPGRGGWLLLFGAGIISVMGIFFIHVTGGQRVEFAPRTTLQRNAFSDTPRLEEKADYTQGGELLVAAVRSIRQQFGAERVFKEITISREGMGIVLRDPQNPKRSVGYFSDPGSLSRKEIFKSSTRSLFSEGEVRESELFSVDEADWTLVPAVVKAGLEQIPIPGGRVSEVALIRRVHPLEEYPPDWKIQVRGGGLIGGESGNAFFDAKSGELTELELPDSLIKPVAYLEPENTQRLLAKILEDFGPGTRFIELSIDDRRALLTATRPKHPNDLRRYGYTATERAKLGKHPPIPVDDPKARGAIFTGAEVASFVPRIDALRAAAFQRLGMKDGKLQSMGFWRKHMVHSPSKNLLVEFRCISPTVGDGYIVYELSGKEFYVALP
jgi:hypothetical protein